MSLQLGACSNLSCGFGCRVFFPLDDTATGLHILRQKCLCGCYGMQHAQPSTTDPTDAGKEPPKSGPNVTQSDGSQGNANPGNSSGFASGPTFTTFTSSSSSKPPLQSFTEAANAAQERMNQKMRDDIRFKKAFNVTQKAASSKARSGTSGLSGKRKKSGADDATVPTKKAATTSASGTKASSLKTRQFKANEKVTFLFVLVHDTEAVHEARFESPNPASLRVYQLRGYLSPITLDIDMDPWEIDYQVKNSFSNTEVGQQHPEYLNGWCLLLDLSQGHGSRALLQPMEGKEGGSNIGYHDIFYARIPAHRQAKSQFKSVVYISLPSGRPSIAVPGLRQYEGEADEEMLTSEEEESVEDDESVSEEDKTSPPNTKAQSPGASDESATPLNSSSIPMLHRLSINIYRSPTSSGPDRDWWPAAHAYPYTSPLLSVTALGQVCDTIDHNPTKASFLSELFSLLKTFVRSLDFLVCLAEILGQTEDPAENELFKNSFKNEFRLGPNGLEPIIQGLNLVHSLISRRGVSVIGSRLSNEFIDHMEPVALSTLDLLLFFRAQVKRASLDPPGFSSLRAALNTKKEIFAEAEAHEMLRILRLNLTTSSVKEFEAALTADFGSINDHQQIIESRLLVGQFGINGMIEKYFDPLLDSMDTTHPNYVDLYDLFQNLAFSLARKITNYKKSHGKRSQPQGSTSRAGTPVTNEEFIGGSGKRQTRSSSAGGNKGSKADPHIISSSSGSEVEWDDDISSSFTSGRQPKGSASYPSVDPKYKKEGFKAPFKAPSPSQKVSDKDRSEVHAIIQELSKTSSLEALLRTILKRFPHAEPARRRPDRFEWPQSRSARMSIWRQVLLIYHPDKNPSADTRTGILYSEIVKLLTTRRP